jgi:hypothetical protein
LALLTVNIILRLLHVSQTVVEEEELEAWRPRFGAVNILHVSQTVVEEGELEAKI